MSRIPSRPLRLARLLALLALVAVLAACASVPRVRVDYDPAAEFGGYRTWSFYDPIAMEKSGYSTWISERVKADVRREMEARGYRYAERDPDLKVNFQGVLRERIDVWPSPYPGFGFGHFYGYRGHHYFGSPLWYDQSQVSQYTEGTLSVDLVDAARNRMVWTGAASSRVSYGRTPQERAAEVDRAIAAIFAAYPFTAGSAQPRIE